MTIIDFLFNIIIMPIQTITEIVYSVLTGILGNKGLTILAVCLVIWILAIPFNKSLEVYNYVGYYIGRLINILYFVAIYSFFSKLQELNGVSFAFIRDLSKPDELLGVGEFSVNIFPILAVILGFISSAICVKGKSISIKLSELVLVIALFITLYNSPSAIALFWTCNKLFTLINNFITKIYKHPERVVSVLGIVACITMWIYLFLTNSISILRIIVILVFAVVCQTPIIVKSNSHVSNVASHMGSRDYKTEGENYNKNWTATLVPSISMTVLLGAFIPLGVISSSATELSIDGSNPLIIVANSLTIFAGLFCLWIPIIYFFMSGKMRKVFSMIYPGISIASFLTYLLFANIHGRMSYLLRYETGLKFSLVQNILSTVLYIGVVTVVALACKRYSDRASTTIKSIFIAITAWMVIICITNTIIVNSSMKEYYKSYEKRGREDLATFSKNGQNVVLIMLDRAIGGYMPFFIDEKPELAEAFSGFTFYPNTLSFGKSTNFGSPAVFGGYEYAPAAMNERSDELLVDKHNEALKMLPKLFSDNGYKVTVCDPPYANYEWVPDLSIYDDIENVNAYITEGAFNLYVSGSNNIKVQKSNFIYYSISKILPTVLQERLYKDGHYCTTIYETRTQSSDFLDCYYAIDNMDVMTNISNDSSNNLFVFQNSVTHIPTILEIPDYVPFEGGDATDNNAQEDVSSQLGTRTVGGVDLVIDDEDKLAQYHANMSAILRVAEWLQYLKDNDVYNNTRIIITSDHGYSLEQLSSCVLSNGIDVEFFNPLLLYKDYGADGELKINNEFMTNADAPVLAVEGIFDNAINPYTGNKISSDEKILHNQLVTMSEIWNTDAQNGTTFKTDDAEWYSVHDYIFDEENWHLVK